MLMLRNYLFMGKVILLLPVAKQNKNCKFDQVKIKIMSTATIKEKVSNVTVVKKMRDYSKEPVFKKKAENAALFIKKNGLPQTFRKSK